jgi:CDP-diacylglycerol--glycerol-3-phosphate 3-phosphatidyltransferase
MRLADKFTLVRALFAPVFFLIYFIPLWTGHFTEASVYIMWPLLGFAEFTDFLDGFFARRKGEVSDFGKLFDPFADVILNLTLFSCLAFSGRMSGVFLLLFIYREFIMNFIRLNAAKKGVAIAARGGGKVKTVLYIASCFFALAIESASRLGFSRLPPITTAVSTTLFVLCVIAAYASLADYIRHFAKFFKADKK